MLGLAVGKLPFAFLTGVVDVPSTASVFPLIRITWVGFVTAFDVMVTLLLNAPILFVSYFTLITLLAPGAIGSFGQTGTVHPQDPFELEIIKGASPVFVNLNS